MNAICLFPTNSFRRLFTSEPIETSTLSFDRDCFAQARARRKFGNEALPTNKKMLFDALGTAGIAVVTVRFDGYSGSGQVDDIRACDADGGVISLANTGIELVRPMGDGSALERSPLTLHDALECLACDLLEDLHRGWQSDEGAFGEFTFDVAKRSITLAYNERVIQSVLYEYTF
ncbi:DUF6878 family protein [Methylosinus sp. Sm6]|uniref:DUF6878 family protein n=1 Tax=Methylosinus sp. Sm6 TaxID=2866948 RepID=UPI001C99815B|nr:DUF6878 family protein [Methylosinus sp. Sm6]MBY6240065.1 hypothetical protein [Methylosinus sp. Sm6]